MFSIEMFPGRTAEGQAKFDACAGELLRIKPNFVSVTFGAGGSTREGTLTSVRKLGQLGHSAVPHLSCVGATRQSVTELLDEYDRLGVNRVVALRGDVPSGWGDIGEFRYANELIEFIRHTCGDRFHIEVAAYPETHPQAKSSLSDLQSFVRKINAGANSAITQYFYNPDAYFRFVEQVRAAGVDVPIVPGVMPITNHAQLLRFSAACGAEIPRWLKLRLTEFGDDLPGLREFGLDVVTRLCERLLADGAPGLHFYTLNQAGATLELWRRLRLAGNAT